MGYVRMVHNKIAKIKNGLNMLNKIPESTSE
jgi:hypothetical protein